MVGGSIFSCLKSEGASGWAGVPLFGPPSSRIDCLKGPVWAGKAPQTSKEMRDHCVQAGVNNLWLPANPEATATSTNQFNAASNIECAPTFLGDSACFLSGQERV